MEAYQPDPQTRKNKIECKPELVIASLQRFYAQHPDVEKVLPYLTGEAPLSLRVIDWVVTKHSRKEFVRYPLRGHDFLLYLSYKGQLKAFSKMYFDANCRRERIVFTIKNHPPITSTIGQLNFFRWALECGVIDYIESHADQIKAGYAAYLKDTVEEQKRNKTEKAVQATQAAAQAAMPLTLQRTNTARPSIEGARTTRRRNKQAPSSLHSLQMVNSEVVLEFN